MKNLIVFMMAILLFNVSYASNFDINEFTNPSDIDGLHYDETGHKIIAEKLAEFIKNN